MDYGTYLTEQILPHWLSISPDRTDGGLFTGFDAHGNPVNTDKNIWFQGRAMWTYAMAYRLCAPRQEYLDICEHIFRFLQTLPRYRLPYITDRTGNTKTFRPIYYYTEMFCAMGCAQYYRICGKPEVWELAEGYFDLIAELYEKNHTTTQEIGVQTPCKTLGLHMAMIATAQFVRNAAPDKTKYDRVIQRAIRELMTAGFVDEENRQIHEYVSLTGAPVDEKLRDCSVPGHIYEAAWFVLCEGALQNDDTIRNFGRKLLDYAMPEGFEAITDVIPTVRDLSKPLAEDLPDAYLTWPQQELIIAFRLAYHMFGEPKYLAVSQQMENTLFSYYDRFEDSVWFQEIFKKDGILQDPSAQGIHMNGPFHFERILLALHCLQKTGSILPYLA